VKIINRDEICEEKENEGYNYNEALFLLPFKFERKLPV